MIIESWKRLAQGNGETVINILNRRSADVAEARNHHQMVEMAQGYMQMVDEQQEHILGIAAALKILVDKQDQL